MSEDVIERVPPPPPPGFGDEEYYRLYGRPEEYHKYRQKLAQSMRMQQRKDVRQHHRPNSSYSRSRPRPSSHSSPPAVFHAPLSVAPVPRAVKGPPFNSYEEEYEHYYGKKNKEKKPHSEEIEEENSEEDEEDDGTPELSSSEEEDEDDEEEISVEELSGSEDGSDGEVFDSEEDKRVHHNRNYRRDHHRRHHSPPKNNNNNKFSSRRPRYENFTVTIHNESEEGTPSLSEDDGERGGRHLSPMRSSSSKNKRVKSIKDRLGVRAARPPSSPPNSPPPSPSRRRRHSSSGSHHASSKRRRANNLSSYEQHKRPHSRRMKSPVKDNNNDTSSSRKSSCKKKRVAEPERNHSSSRRKGGGSLRNGHDRRSPSRRRKDSSRENGGGDYRNGRRSSSPKKRSRFGQGTTKMGSRRRRRSPPLRGMESETHRRAERLLTRSPEERKSERHPGQKWQHDKFRDLSGSPIHVEDDAKKLEGSHWKRIRSERSKERDRRNGRHRSRSRSRSRKRRRRSKRHSSRSSSRSSSSSRSRSSRSRSRSYSRSSSRSSRSMSSFSSSSSRSSASSRSRSSLDSYLRSRRKRRHRRSASPRQNNVNNNNTKSSDKLLSSGVVQKDTSALPPDVHLVDEKEQPHFYPASKSGEENHASSNGVKYSEPPDFRRPRTKWRLYVFKGNEELPILYIHRQSSYLLGRDRKVADVPLDHPSCSKQHAALQYRLVQYSRPDGTRGKRVRPYVIDLNSANGTFINNKKIEPQKFVQVLEKDVLKFGFSSRECVLLHDQTNDAENEDLGLDS